MALTSLTQSVVIVIFTCCTCLSAPPPRNVNHDRSGNGYGNGRHNGHGQGFGHNHDNGHGLSWGNGNGNGNHGRPFPHFTASDWDEYIRNHLQNQMPDPVGRPIPGSDPREPHRVPTWGEWLEPWKSSLENCGYPGTSPSFIDLRIATLPEDRHSYAKLGNYPWMVSLKWTPSNSHWCGGILISDQWVITAAHCLFSVPPQAWGEKFWTARLGVLNISSTHEAMEQVFNVEKILVHPLFDGHMVLSRDSVGKPSDHDIALVKLSGRAEVSPFVRPICLPQPDEMPPAGTHCVITGWGFSSGSQELSDTLKQARVPIMDYDLCKALPDGYDKLLTPNVLCAGYWEGGVDACKFDSGGPLQCQNGQQWIVVGVVSWGDKNGDRCAKPMRPGVYTRVDPHVTWVQATIYRDYAGLPQITWDQVLPHPWTHSGSYDKR